LIHLNVVALRQLHDEHHVGLDLKQRHNSPALAAVRSFDDLD
jgi:hypothetical protein